MNLRKSSNDRLGMSSPIRRRDFVNGALAGGSAALLAGCGSAPGADRYAPSGSAWTGYGGVGDYSRSNGNTESVTEAAHRFRDGAYPDPSAVPVDETVDLVIVGGGFSGMTAAYEFSKRAGRSEEHTSELQSLMRISYAVFCLKKKTNHTTTHRRHTCHAKQ